MGNPNTTKGTVGSEMTFLIGELLLSSKNTYLHGTCIHEKLCTIKLCYKISVFMYEDKVIFQDQIFIIGFFK